MGSPKKGTLLICLLLASICWIHPGAHSLAFHSLPWGLMSMMETMNYMFTTGGGFGVYLMA